MTNERCGMRVHVRVLGVSKTGMPEGQFEVRLPSTATIRSPGSVFSDFCQAVSTNKHDENHRGVEAVSVTDGAVASRCLPGRDGYDNKLVVRRGIMLNCDSDSRQLRCSTLGGGRLP